MPTSRSGHARTNAATSSLSGFVHHVDIDDADQSAAAPHPASDSQRCVDRRAQIIDAEIHRRQRRSPPQEAGTVRTPPCPLLGSTKVTKIVVGGVVFVASAEAAMPPRALDAQRSSLGAAGANSFLGAGSRRLISTDGAAAKSRQQDRRSSKTRKSG